LESLGDKLKTAREEKGLSIEHVGKETNIAVRYIDALEKENFSGFPSETYITGFLRSYSSYLNLNTNEILSLYRAFKIQEQPIPVEQLLKSPSKLPKILITFGIILGIIGAGGLAAFLITKPKQTEEHITVSRQRAEHVMNENSLERRIYSGDSILVPIELEQYKLELTNIGDAVTILTPNGSVILDLSHEVNIDLSNNGIPDLVITVIDFVRNNPDMGALLRFNKVNISASDVFYEEDTSLPVMGAVTGTALSRIVLTSPNPFPFTLQANFDQYCMFRWEILFERDRAGRNERYFQRTDELNIQAQNGIRIWSSNARAARFQVIGGGQTVSLELGSPGEVVVAELRWLRDENNLFRLVLARLET